MTLQQVIRAVEGVAAQQPPVNSIVRNDVFRLNAWPSVRYGAFAWLQGEHTLTEDGRFARWAFTLFYVDRLTANRSNEIEIQSAGIVTLGNVIRQLAELGLFAGDATFQTFTQRFADECAGVFCSVTIETTAGTLCPVAYVEPGDFSEDFNDDFLVWRSASSGKIIYIK